jgi:adhesin transport system membrane fusion protein
MIARALMTVAPITLDPMRGPRLAVLVLLSAVTFLLFAFLLWASLARLDIMAKGEGTVVPSSRIQVVQNLEGGILRDVPVREGDRVSEGEVVAQIDDTGAESSYHEDLSTYRAYQATAARLEAEANSKPLEFPKDLRQASDGPGLISSETLLFQSRMAELANAVSIFERQKEQAQQSMEDAREQSVHLDAKLRSLKAEHALVAQQVNEGLMSVVEKLRLERLIAETNEQLSKAHGDERAAQIQLEELSSRIAEKKSTFVSEAREDLAKKQAELAALSQRLIVHRDRVGRREVRSPVNGIVKRIATLTQGAVIEPGGTIMEIVPLDDVLLIEAKISPSDIAFIHKGQAARVRLTAYDFSVYGALPGEVETVGADTVTLQDGTRYYPVTVRVDQNALEGRQAKLPIIPGMISEVSIVTGSRTILGYLLKPVLKIKEQALQER